MSYGSDALETFYDISVMKYGNKNLPKSFSEFMGFLNSHKNNSYKILERSLTNAIQLMHDESIIGWGIDSDVDKAMVKLAEISQGKLPNAGAFIQALSDKFSEVTLTEYYEKAVEVAEAFENVGKGILTTMNLSRFAIPALVIGGASLFVYFKVRRA